MLMKTDELGIPRFSNRDLMDMIYTGHVDKCHMVLCDPSDDIDRFNTAMEEQGLPTLTKYVPLDVDEKTFDGVCQSEWFMPEEYKNLDIHKWCKAKLMEQLQTTSYGTTELSTERLRIDDEINAFTERGMLDVLRYMVYLVDFMRKNNIVWGVGRGSSVASYVLYLIGIHKINPIQYGLDWHEFLR